MSTKVKIDVEVPEGKELLIKEITPEKLGKFGRSQEVVKTVASFKKGKGKIEWTISGPSYLTFEELENEHH